MTWLLAAQAQARKRAGPRLVAGLMTNGTLNRLTRMEHTSRKIKNGHRRREGTTERHDETTSTVGDGRKITEKTLMDRVNHTKRLKSTLDIVIGQLDWQVAHEDRTDMLISSGDGHGDVAIEEGGPLEELVSVLSGLGSNSYTATSQELHSFNLMGIKASQQLWYNITHSLCLVDFGRKMENHTSWERHLLQK